MLTINDITPINKAFAKFFNGKVKAGKGVQAGSKYASFNNSRGWYIGTLNLGHDDKFKDWNKIMTLVEIISNVGFTVVEIRTSSCRITPIIYNLATDSMKWMPIIECRKGSMIDFTCEAIALFMDKYAAHNKTELAYDHKLI